MGNTISELCDTLTLESAKIGLGSCVETAKPSPVEVLVNSLGFFCLVAFPGNPIVVQGAGSRPGSIERVGCDHRLVNQIPIGGC